MLKRGACAEMSENSSNGNESYWEDEEELERECGNGGQTGRQDSDRGVAMFLRDVLWIVMMMMVMMMINSDDDDE